MEIGKITWTGTSIISSMRVSPLKKTDYRVRLAGFSYQTVYNYVYWLYNAELVLLVAISGLNTLDFFLKLCSLLFRAY